MKRTCSLPECSKPHRALGLCVTHYNQLDPNRHRPKEMPCAWCGAMVSKLPRSAAKFGVVCSTACRGNLLRMSLRGERRSTCTDLATTVRLERSDERPRPNRRPRKWFAGACQACGSSFVSRHFERTCSEACKVQRDADVKRHHKHLRRARVRGAAYENFTRTEIFERDDWTCWICRKPVDRDADPQSDVAPSLDHIIPLANGGTHERANVATACRGCNARRSNRPTLMNRAGVAIPALF